MSKKISISSKKSPENNKKEPFYLFVKDQGEGAAKIIVIILKILSLILTSLFALALGIFAPLCIWFTPDFVDPDIQTNIAVVFWLTSSITYVIGTFILMMGHSRIATIVHTAAVVQSFLTYYNYMLLFADIPDNNGPTILYLPSIFIFVISVIIMLLINIPKWLNKRAEAEFAVAPSIIIDDDKEK